MTEVVEPPAHEAGSRERILDAAAQAFMRQGFRSTTIDDIAHELGATKGLIYYHFRSKFDLFLAVYEEGMSRARDRVRPNSEGNASGRERLAAMSVAHVRNLMTDLAYHHVVHQGVRAKDSVELKVRQRDALDTLNDHRRDYERMFRQIVEEGIADGSLRATDPVLAARTLLSSLNGVDLWFRTVEGQGEDEVADLAERIVDLLVGGLAA